MQKTLKIADAPMAAVAVAASPNAAPKLSISMMTLNWGDTEIIVNN